MNKPQSIITLLTQRFDNTELSKACIQLGTDAEMFGAGRTNLAMGLVQYCERQGKLIQLFEELSLCGKEIDFKPYFYMHIAGAYSSIDAMKGLASQLFIDYAAELVKGLGYRNASGNSDVIEIQSLYILGKAIENGSFNNLVNMATKGKKNRQHAVVLGWLRRV